MFFPLDGDSWDALSRERLAEELRRRAGQKPHLEVLKGGANPAKQLTLPFGPFLEKRER